MLKRHSVHGMEQSRVVAANARLQRERQGWMLSQIINLLPGVLAAVAGFFSILFMDFLAVESSWLRFCVFIVVYIIVNVAFDKAMMAYGRK